MQSLAAYDVLIAPLFSETWDSTAPSSEATRLPGRGNPRWDCRRRSDLERQINSLSAREKADLLDTVWESLEANSGSLPDAQRAELDYRSAWHEQNRSDVIPGQQVRAGLFKKP
jgi:putative addiction module component (TIGR02574 family)